MFAICTKAKLVVKHVVCRVAYIYGKTARIQWIVKIEEQGDICERKVFCSNNVAQNSFL